VTELTTIVYCLTCGAFWTEGAEPGCTDATHEHQRHERHRHRTPVTLPDGTGVVAVSFEDLDPYGRADEPDFGLYLDGRWDPPWPHEHVDWPDFGVPADAAAVLGALHRALDRARAGERVEVGCLGAHGRTGTALACLAVLTGIAPGDAVAWVRDAYCAHAVETDEQAAFVARLDADRRLPDT
jgi:hypothetical protein